MQYFQCSAITSGYRQEPISMRSTIFCKTNMNLGSKFNHFSEKKNKKKRGKLLK